MLKSPTWLSYHTALQQKGYKNWNFDKISSERSYYVLKYFFWNWVLAIIIMYNWSRQHDYLF